MATTVSGLAPNASFPECGGRIDTISPSRSGLLAAVVIGDIAVNLLAGLLVVVGFFWEFAWLLAVGVVVFAMVRRVWHQPLYRCIQCNREFTYKAVYGSK